MRRSLLALVLPFGCVAQPVEVDCLTLTEVSTNNGGQQVDLGLGPFKLKGPVRFDETCALDRLSTQQDRAAGYPVCDSCSIAYCPDWFELCNFTDAPLSTADFTVSNLLEPHPFARAEFDLPERTIVPGACEVFVTDDDAPEFGFACEALGILEGPFVEPEADRCGVPFTLDRELGGRLAVLPRPAVAGRCRETPAEFAVAGMAGLTFVPEIGEDGEPTWRHDEPTPGWVPPGSRW